MLALVDPQPVALPRVLAMMVGIIAFMSAFAAARRAQAGWGEGAARRSPRSIAGIVIQMIGFTLVGTGPILVVRDPASPVAIGEALGVVALMLLTVGLFLAATLAMGRNWSPVARTREDHELITTGPFAAIRHPIYTGLFAFMLALALGFGHWRGLILGVPLYWLGTWLRIAEEEKLLRAQFGAAYDAYAARVKRFVPGVI